MAEITQDISSLGSVPTTADPATFDARADTFLGTALPTLRTEINTWAGQANALGADVTTKSATATSAANAAQSSETAAVASANFKGEWAALTGSLAAPASVRHNGRVWNLLVSIADVTLSEPGVSSDWAVLSQFYLDQRTTNTAITLTDFGQIIDITGGTFTQTFDAASALGNGFYVQYRVSGNGTITLDPSGADTINITTAGQYDNFLIICDGVSKFTVIPVREKTVITEEFTSSGTWTKSSGTKFVMVEVWGAGGGGGAGCLDTNGVNRASGAGGGSGSYVKKVFPASELAASVAVTVGAGGSGGESTVTNGAPGSTGGVTSFGAHLFGYGGGGGAGGATDTSNANAGGKAGLIAASSLETSSSTAFDLYAADGGAGTSGDGNPGARSVAAGGGGGSGGGLDAAANTFNGGAGGIGLQGAITGGGGAGGTPGGTLNGADGADYAGGGGGASGTSSAGNGGAGGIASGGGGGGAKSSLTAPAGLGGNGGDGFVRVTAW